MEHVDKVDEFRLVSKTSNDIQHVFSVDVEEWFQVGAFENALSRSDWSNLESRVVYQTNRILDLLEKNDVLATFFCLGWVAKREPKLIRKIVDAGHEVACHGMDHKRLHQMNIDEFAKDIHESKKLIEDASGTSVLGYRAPSFSMCEQTWAFYEKLIDAGFRYSSSVFPAKTDHYGISQAPRVPFFPLDGNDFIEVPMTIAKVGSLSAPASGGGYFRLLPSFVSNYLMDRAFDQTNVSTIFYMHPWEVDPDQPRVKHASLLSKIRHYTKQDQMWDKLDALLQKRRFTRLDTMLRDQYKFRIDA